VQEIVSSEWLEEYRMLTSKRLKLKQKLWVCGILPAKVFGLSPAEMIENPRRLLGKELKDGRYVCMCVCVYLYTFGKELLVFA